MKKQRRAKGARKQSAKKEPRRAGAGLSAVPTEALAAELRRRRSELPKLEKTARELRARLAEVEARIASLAGDAAAAPHGARPAGDSAKAAAFRPSRRGKPTLAVQILEHLRSAGSAQPRAEIVHAMARATGREPGASLSVHVSATLRKLVNSGEATQVGRGLYAAKDAVHAAAQ